MVRILERIKGQRQGHSNNHGFQHEFFNCDGNLQVNRNKVVAIEFNVSKRYLRRVGSRLHLCR